MATIKLGPAGSWTDAFNAADFDNLASGGGKLSTASAVTNGSGLDLRADVSFIMVTSTISPTTAGAHLQLMLLPLLHDGSTYPSNEDTSTAANLPAGSLTVGTIHFRAKSGSSVSGIATDIIIPPGTFKWYVINRTGVSLPASSTNMTCKYRLYSLQVA